MSPAQAEQIAAQLALAEAVAPPPVNSSPTRQAATRFLTQATFGATQQEVDRVRAIGYQAWLNEQFAAPVSSMSHLSAWDASDKAIRAIDAGSRATKGNVVSSFWREAITSPDQLRQRVAFALSEIFVISVTDSCGDNAFSRGAADYLDTLGRQAFGSYRALLESVAIHPIMGCYLSHIKNQPEDTPTGRVPDENFAREIMQLFSIGLYELNADGTHKTDAHQQPIETYSASDISGMAKVFTGWSWWCSQGQTAGCFFSNPNHPEQLVTSMRGYALYHSTAEKSFLGTVIPASTWATPESSLKVALDTLASHPNVGPFIGKQLIQRLVTSNPSPAYVQRVANAFKLSGGSMKAMVTAILLDPEARDMASLGSDRFGKVREPVLRFSALLRSMGAHSDSGMFLIMATEDPGFALAQSALSSSSVFNFFRPGYVKPGSQSASALLLAPELQIATETSSAGYVNYLMYFLRHGTGLNGYDRKASRADVQLLANIDPDHALLTLADKPADLVEEINQRLMYGTMPLALKTEIVGAVQSVGAGLLSNLSVEKLTENRRRRLWSALLLTMASPEFQIQK
ncbi:DUF1800 family protein [Aquabacterium sp.]|uniref:DUF1800 domain-containing protein n=1 Tax=Aquabacterium sp. TaxID=1872578 RepID=UPI00248708E5|nr:DUF1800 family protein [Aquabacterium sp.]MDI1257867.1 DUF1800 family protein [Aquabacterium sp.]